MPSTSDRACERGARRIVGVALLAALFTLPIQAQDAPAADHEAQRVGVDAFARFAPQTADDLARLTPRLMDLDPDCAPVLRLDGKPIDGDVTLQSVAIDAVAHVEIAPLDDARHCAEINVVCHPGAKRATAWTLGGSQTHDGDIGPRLDLDHRHGSSQNSWQHTIALRRDDQPRDGSRAIRAGTGTVDDPLRAREAETQQLTRDRFAGSSRLRRALGGGMLDVRLGVDHRATDHDIIRLRRPPA
ncbi:MAG: hypothetical protein AAF772_10960, partial [Acidobacteriota bacterium]